MTEPAGNVSAIVDGAPLETTTFSALQPGPRLLVLGAVHGNETCGPIAIRRIVEECRSGAIKIRRGSVTFLPVANPKAYRQGTREGDRNLNRDLHDKPVPLDHEDRVGNRICALLRTHDVLLDIHSFTGEGEPFVFFGPPDNSGLLEPFRHADAELAFAASLGVTTLIHGWLENYERLVAIQPVLGLPPLSPSEGHGTTEYMRFAGGYGCTIECGSHDDPASAEVAYRAIRNALAALALADEEKPESQVTALIHMRQVIVCEAEDDRLEGDWKTGDKVTAGDGIARRTNGKAVTAPSDGYIIFPNRKAKIGQGICYFGTDSERRIPGETQG